MRVDCALSVNAYYIFGWSTGNRSTSQPDGWLLLLSDKMRRCRHGSWVTYGLQVRYFGEYGTDSSDVTSEHPRIKRLGLITVANFDTRTITVAVLAKE